MIRENRIEPDSKEYVYTFYWNKIYKRLLHRRKRKAALRADYIPMIIENRSIPEQSHMCPMNMMVLHSDVDHMIIPSSPRLYRIESIGWTNFIPDRSIPFILMMCEHGWRDYSANQQTSKIIQIRFDWHFIIRRPTDWKEPPAEDGSEDMNLTRRSNSTYFSSW